MNNPLSKHIVNFDKMKRTKVEFRKEFTEMLNDPNRQTFENSALAKYLYQKFSETMIQHPEIPPEVIAEKIREELIKASTMTKAEYNKITAQIAILKEIAEKYSGKTIDNIIVQLEGRMKEAEKTMKKAINY